MAPFITPEITSNIQWVSQMDVDVEPTAGRKTTVIGTIGKVIVLTRITVWESRGFNIHCLYVQVPTPTVLK